MRKSNKWNSFTGNKECSICGCARIAINGKQSISKKKRYVCCNCGHVRQNKSRVQKKTKIHDINPNELLRLSVEEKMNYEKIGLKYHISSKVVGKIIKKAKVEKINYISEDTRINSYGDIESLKETNSDNQRHAAKQNNLEESAVHRMNIENTIKYQGEKQSGCRSTASHPRNYNHHKYSYDDIETILSFGIDGNSARSLYENILMESFFRKRLINTKSRKSIPIDLFRNVVIPCEYIKDGFEDAFKHKSNNENITTTACYREYMSEINTFKEENVILRKIKNRHVVLAMDATYFGQYRGVVMLRDWISGENIAWTWILREKIMFYVDLIELAKKELGLAIDGIVCDGFSGLLWSFGGIPVQMCLYHMQKIIHRLITNKPKHEAGKEILIINSLLGCSNETVIKFLLQQWYEKYRDILREKHGNGYTYQKEIDAYNSFLYHWDHLFIYQKFSGLHIPTTNNTIEATWNWVKRYTNIHSYHTPEALKQAVDMYLSIYHKGGYEISKKYKKPYNRDPK